LADHPEALGDEVRPAHLETCEECRAQVEGLERLLRHALQPEEVPVPPELARRVDEAVVARYGGGGRPRRGAWILASVLLVALLLAAGGGVVVSLRPKEDTAGSPMLSNVPADAGDHRRSREIPSAKP
jgi:predicted anti-sigma-YlaC factor YlaD